MILLDFAILIFISLFHQRQIKNIMKRNSITDIIRKAQLLSVLADRETSNFHQRPITECAETYRRYLAAINKAAVNEIIRLDQDSTPALPSNLAINTPGADPVSLILDTISHFPGYEFLKK